MPKPNSATVHTFSRSLERSFLATSPNSCRIFAAICPPLTSTTIPFSICNSICSSSNVESHDPSIISTPFIVPSLGIINALPAGRLVNILGRLHIPLSSNFHSRQFTSNVISVPWFDFTLTMRLLLKYGPRLLIRFLILLKSAAIPP